MQRLKTGTGSAAKLSEILAQLAMLASSGRPTNALVLLVSVRMAESLESLAALVAVKSSVPRLR
jgi:hypothetical protein